LRQVNLRSKISIAKTIIKKNHLQINAFEYKIIPHKNALSDFNKNEWSFRIVAEEI